MEPYQKYLDKRTINKIIHLELRARRIVEGFLSGMHKSPYYGFSVEFAAHREYVPGDDIRHLDWKVYGRSDRLFLKEYELETNLRSHILLDSSESMLYGSGDRTKLELACFVAASVAYLILNQQDAVSLTCFDKEVKSHLPSKSGMGQLKPVLTQLAMATPEKKTDISVVLNVLAERIKFRGLIIIISDLFDKIENIVKGLQHLRFKRHDVIIFHILDEYELSFPFQRMTLFDGLEEYPKILCDPRSLRREYLEAVNNFCAQVKRECVALTTDYEQITTDRQIDVALSKYLAARLGTRLRRTGRQ
jgi:uncharacterized protein (DUF58 family)